MVDEITNAVFNHNGIGCKATIAIVVETNCLINYAILNCSFQFILESQNLKSKLFNDCGFEKISKSTYLT